MTDRQIYPNHHEETLYTQKGFETDILSLIQTIEEIGSPFLKESTTDLSTPDTEDVMDQKMTTIIKN